MNRQAFFDSCRKGIMGPALDAGEVSGSEAILDAMQGTPISHCAYALATAWHETAHSMQPISEYGGNSYFFRMYDPQGQRPKLAKAYGNVNPGDGVRYRGRGYVQLTWRVNYRKFGRLLHIPLEDNPGLAMEPGYAAQIMRQGMDGGLFTGKAFSHFLPNDGPAIRGAFVNARRIINGADKAGLIADYAIQFQDALTVGGWQ